ncbi:MAG TPA: ATP-binding protein [Terracidiphilus sp.]|nr:ATP-binding protein [Terracidiphilus sp.]
MKKEVDHINATPSKRLFLSIIADYNLNRSICELVDNALDVRTRSRIKGPVNVQVRLEERQQAIEVVDDAGGLKQAELKYIVGPGQTGTSTSDETIGIFGVGTKRAVVALAQDIKITTRFAKQKTLQIDFDEAWLADESWELPVYEVDEIDAGTTIVELQKLRLHINTDAISLLREHLGATYALFIKSGRLNLKLNGISIVPHFFEDWSFPPNYSPRKYTGTLDTEDGGSVRVTAIAGLTSESSPAAGEYGVYFYCNDRLVARALKTYEVGFSKGVAGLPHPKISLTRVLVFLNGDAQLMPWNSSKSDISSKHEVFSALRGWLISVVKDFAALSRIWMGDWPDKVFQYKEGEIAEVAINDFPTATRSFLPSLPKSRPRYGDIISQKNRDVVRKKPWSKGLYEGVVAADLISKQRLEQRNRIALIVLDSTLEIGFKDYLVNESGTSYSDVRLVELFKDRSQVQNEVKKTLAIKDEVWKKVNFYYNLRCKLVHEKATAPVDDGQIENFRLIVEAMLHKMFGLKFKK